MKKNRQDIVAALDIGTTKIVCFIAEIASNGEPVIRGIGHHVSQGIRAGTIIDIKKAEEAIRSAVGAAEEMAEVNIDRVVVNISGSRQQSHSVHVQMDIAGREISPRDTKRLIEQGCAPFYEGGNDVLHCIPLYYTIDDHAGIHEPVGMYGNVLQASLHVVTASSTVLYNLASCLARCHLDIEGYLVSSYASSLACLGEDEKKLGAVVLDMGGGSTSIAICKEGNMVYADVVPVGGGHITNDIAVGLSTNIASAERIKALYGDVIMTAKDEQQLIDIPQIHDNGDSETVHIQRSILVGIIRARVEEWVEMIKQKLESCEYFSSIGKVVLTGGVSQLAGFKDFIAYSLDRQVRIGMPFYINGLAESTKGPAFSACIGNLKYISQKRMQGQKQQFKAGKGMRRMTQWIKKNF